MALITESATLPYSTFEREDIRISPNAVNVSLNMELWYALLRPTIP